MTFEMRNFNPDSKLAVVMRSLVGWMGKSVLKLCKKHITLCKNMLLKTLKDKRINKKGAKKMKEILITQEMAGENATKILVETLTKEENKKDTLIKFEKGTYHFYEDDSYEKFFGITNNDFGVKKIAMPIFGCENITIDGGESVFIMHRQTFPIFATESKGITIKNMIFDRIMSPVAPYSITDISDEGFLLKFDREITPYTVKDGRVIFHRENRDTDMLDRVLSMHKAEYHHVRYLAARNCKEDLTNLAAPHFLVDAEERENGVYFRYCENTPTKCDYDEGQRFITMLDGSREITIACFDKSEQILVKDVIVRRGLGMGILAQLSKDIEVDNFSSDVEFHGENVSFTADALHFVHCDGKVEVHNCHITDIMDDSINFHGNYTGIKKVEKNRIVGKEMHQQTYYFNQYVPGDVVRLIDAEKLDIVAHFKVEKSGFTGDDGIEMELIGEFLDGFENASENCYIENYMRVPEAHVHHNRFERFPHIRISGGKKMVVEDNVLIDSSNGVLSSDLIAYWYETGRINDLTIRNNIIDTCLAEGILIYVAGYDENTPLVHDRIEISGNTIKNTGTLYKAEPISAKGVKNLVLKDNIIE